MVKVTKLILAYHRALEDVRAMQRIFSTNNLKPLLSLLTIRSKAQIVEHWQQKHQELATMQQYTIHFGRSCTKAMSKRLSQLKLSYDALKSVFDDNIDNRQAFNKQLHKSGITRKAWCEKMWEHFRSRRKPT